MRAGREGVPWPSLGMPAALLLLLVSTRGAVPPEIADLDLTNFDTFLAEHETVLVHFWAPCAHNPCPTFYSYALPC